MFRERVDTRSEFLQRATVELKRAERYHVFLSLICLDLSFVQSWPDETAQSVLNRLNERVQAQVRVCDVASVLSDGCLALLYPETNRDGAERAARRVAATVREELNQVAAEPSPEMIHLEIASFPDAAGARSVADLLGAISSRLSN